MRLKTILATEEQQLTTNENLKEQEHKSSHMNYKTNTKDLVQITLPEQLNKEHGLPY